MSTELRDLLNALTAGQKAQAQLIERLAGLIGYDDTAEDARVLADAIGDAFVDWDSYTAERTI